MIFLLEASACLIAFYAVYHFVLRGKSFHKWNRVYLLSTLCLSFIIPLISLPVWEVVVTLPSNISTNNANPQTTLYEVAPSSALDIWIVIIGIYIIGVVILMMKLIIELTQITSLIRSSKQISCDGYIEVNVPKTFPLSSFLNYMLIPSKDELTTFEYHHELAHITQNHSYDKLFTSIATSLVWFNPIVYLYQKSLHEVHEYLADEAVINQSKKDQYLNFLYTTISKNYNYNTLSPFYSLIKNRLTMMNQNSKSSKKLFLWMLPILFVLVGIFACEEYTTIEGDETNSVNTDQVVLNSQGQELYTVKDTIIIFDAETYEETVQIIDRTLTPEQYENYLKAQQLGEDDIFLQDPENSIQDDIKQVDINGEKRAYSIVDTDSGQEKYLLSTDTITFFDEDTYEETIRVVENYATKEVYDAYQDALNNQRFIIITNESTNEKYAPQLIYEVPLDYLKQNAHFIFAEGQRYSYEISELGKIIKSSTPINLADLK